MFFELPAIQRLREDVFSNFGNYPVFFVCYFILIPISLLCSLICLIFIFRKINALEQKTVRMRDISDSVSKGAIVYLKDQAKMLLIILAILFIPVSFTGLEFLSNPLLAFLITGVIFILGALSSIFAGFIGMRTATKANILVAEASIDDPNEGFKLAYYGGMITGILNISLFVLGIWIILLITNGNIFLITGFCFGASVSALLSQVGGGIFTKSADMGADLVGKFELDIPEDDPRNPAIIADLVGDNVGDCAGRGADLYESASSDVIGGMLLGLSIFLLIGDPIFIIINITLISLGVFSLFFTTLFLKIDFERPSKSIWKVFTAAISFNILILAFLSFLLFGPYGYYLFFSSLLGFGSVAVAIMLTTYYTSMDYKPTQDIAESSNESSALTIIGGITTGFSSVFLPILIFVISVIGSFFFGYTFGSIYYYEIFNQPTIDLLGSEINQTYFLIAFGIWGVNMASVTSDLIISSILSFDTFGPIVDNAAGIAEMGGAEDNVPPDLRINLDKLDAVGNTTKAVAKGFALLCGGFSSIVMFLTFLQSAHNLAGTIPSFIPETEIRDIFFHLDIYNPLIIAGIFMGVLIPVLFSSMVLKAVQKGSKKMVKEVRCQFKNIPGLKQGDKNARPDYERCIDISAEYALKNMLKPVLAVISLTIITGILFGPMVIAGLLIGNLIGCLVFGLFMSISGASLDNAKKGIEVGLYDGKGSKAHKASIIGDTVGDPLKDTTGPSMNILITTINTMAITFLPVFIMTGFLWVLIPI